MATAAARLRVCLDTIVGSNALQLTTSAACYLRCVSFISLQLQQKRCTEKQSHKEHGNVTLILGADRAAVLPVDGQVVVVAEEIPRHCGHSRFY